MFRLAAYTLLFTMTLSTFSLGTDMVRSQDQESSQSFYAYPNEPLRHRGLLARTVISFLVPGFDQLANGHTGAGMAYAGLGLAGIFTVAAAGSTDEYVTTKSERARTILLGAQLYQTMGSLSSFHAFRSVVVGRRTEGEFSFLAVEETPGDLLLAPFRVDYFIRPTTFVPLLLLGGLIVGFAGNDPINFSMTDGFFTGAFSYQAGLGEEAIFRGVIQPSILEFATNGQALTANLIQALIFAGLHYSDQNKLPWPQFVLGAYLGWLTEHNNYTLSENIFLHTWWDVIAIGAAYAYSGHVSRPVNFFVPLVDMRF